MTIQEIESACMASQPLDFSRHPLEGPVLSQRRTFYPLGFPAEVRTNSPEILCLYREMWGMFKRKFNNEIIRVDIHLVESDSTVCPPKPVVRMMQPTLAFVADSYNHSIAHLGRNHTQITVSRAALRHKRYLLHFFLGSSAAHHIATKHATPIHAGCVALDDRGVLLCGDSGAGKSSLAYACARAGWTFVADDATFLLNGGGSRLVTGDCHHVRLRPAAADLFPEINGLKMTPRVAGKPSIELALAGLPNIVRAQSVKVDFIVFLNRCSGQPPALLPYRRDVARYFMRQVLYGSTESLALQYEAIERLLALQVRELSYDNLEFAIQQLKTLVRERR